ncbi:serine/threonine protein kinase [Plasmodium vivax Mauritania I]|uniref:non-specific serine/threonine protein kinase n=1 Tax=Plasmodium vivax Mauritania I TaxID=1035515 RepID=A0A0J9W546_PLAVI|nr:serine/threonine protein kinase [Plasmodium vivax Mauritania I]
MDAGKQLSSEEFSHINKKLKERFIFVYLIAVGGFSCVYKIRKKRNGHPGGRQFGGKQPAERHRSGMGGKFYALKNVKFSANRFNWEKKIKLNLREVECLNKLKNHPNIVGIRECWLEVNERLSGSRKSRGGVATSLSHRGRDPHQGGMAAAIEVCKGCELWEMRPVRKEATPLGATNTAAPAQTRVPPPVGETNGLQLPFASCLCVSPKRGRAKGEGSNCSRSDILGGRTSPILPDQVEKKKRKGGDAARNSLDVYYYGVYVVNRERQRQTHPLSTPQLCKTPLQNGNCPHEGNVDAPPCCDLFLGRKSYSHKDAPKKGDILGMRRGSFRLASLSKELTPSQRRLRKKGTPPKDAHRGYRSVSARVATNGGVPSAQLKNATNKCKVIARRGRSMRGIPLGERFTTEGGAARHSIGFYPFDSQRGRTVRSGPPSEGLHFLTPHYEPTGETKRIYRNARDKAIRKGKIKRSSITIRLMRGPSHGHTSDIRLEHSGGNYLLRGTPNGKTSERRFVKREMDSSHFWIPLRRLNLQVKPHHERGAVQWKGYSPRYGNPYELKGVATSRGGSTSGGMHANCVGEAKPRKRTKKGATPMGERTNGDTLDVTDRLHQRTPPRKSHPKRRFLKREDTPVAIKRRLFTVNSFCGGRPPFGGKEGRGNVRGHFLYIPNAKWMTQVLRPDHSGRCHFIWGRGTNREKVVSLLFSLLKGGSPQSLLPKGKKNELLTWSGHHYGFTRVLRGRRELLLRLFKRGVNCIARHKRIACELEGSICEGSLRDGDVGRESVRFVGHKRGRSSPRVDTPWGVQQDVQEVTPSGGNGSVSEGRTPEGQGYRDYHPSCGDHCGDFDCHPRSGSIPRARDSIHQQNFIQFRCSDTYFVHELKIIINDNQTKRSKWPHHRIDLFYNNYHFNSLFHCRRGETVVAKRQLINLIFSNGNEQKQRDTVLTLMKGVSSSWGGRKKKRRGFNDPPGGEKNGKMAECTADVNNRQLGRRNGSFCAAPCFVDGHADLRHDEEEAHQVNHPLGKDERVKGSPLEGRKNAKWKFPPRGCLSMGTYSQGCPSHEDARPRQFPSVKGKDGSQANRVLQREEDEEGKAPHAEERTERRTDHPFTKNLAQKRRKFFAILCGGRRGGSAERMSGSRSSRVSDASSASSYFTCYYCHDRCYVFLFVFMSALGAKDQTALRSSAGGKNHFTLQPEGDCTERRRKAAPQGSKTPSNVKHSFKVNRPMRKEKKKLNVCYSFSCFRWLRVFIFCNEHVRRNGLNRRRVEDVISKIYKRITITTCLLRIRVEDNVYGNTHFLDLYISRSVMKGKGRESIPFERITRQNCYYTRGGVKNNYFVKKKEFYYYMFSCLLEVRDSWYFSSVGEYDSYSSLLNEVRVRIRRFGIYADLLLICTLKFFRGFYAFNRAFKRHFLGGRSGKSRSNGRSNGRSNERTRYPPNPRERRRRSAQFFLCCVKCCQVFTAKFYTLLLSKVKRVQAGLVKLLSQMEKNHLNKLKHHERTPFGNLFKHNLYCFMRDGNFLSNKKGFVTLCRSFYSRDPSSALVRELQNFSSVTVDGCNYAEIVGIVNGGGAPRRGAANRGVANQGAANSGEANSGAANHGAANQGNARLSCRTPLRAPPKETHRKGRAKRPHLGYSTDLHIPNRVSARGGGHTEGEPKKKVNCPPGQDHHNTHKNRIERGNHNFFLANILNFLMCTSLMRKVSTEEKSLVVNVTEEEEELIDGCFVHNFANYCIYFVYYVTKIKGMKFYNVDASSLLRLINVEMIRHTQTDVSFSITSIGTPMFHSNLMLSFGKFLQKELRLCRYRHIRAGGGRRSRAHHLRGRTRRGLHKRDETAEGCTPFNFTKLHNLLHVYHYNVLVESFIRCSNAASLFLEHHPLVFRHPVRFITRGGRGGNACTVRATPHGRSGMSNRADSVRGDISELRPCQVRPCHAHHEHCRRVIKLNGPFKPTKCEKKMLLRVKQKRLEDTHFVSNLTEMPLCRLMQLTIGRVILKHGSNYVVLIIVKSASCALQSVQLPQMNRFPLPGFSAYGGRSSVEEGTRHKKRASTAHSDYTSHTAQRGGRGPVRRAGRRRQQKIKKGVLFVKFLLIQMDERSIEAGRGAAVGRVGRVGRGKVGVRNGGRIVQKGNATMRTTIDSAIHPAVVNGRHPPGEDPSKSGYPHDGQRKKRESQKRSETNLKKRKNEKTRKEAFRNFVDNIVYSSESGEFKIVFQSSSNGNEESPGKGEEEGLRRGSAVRGVGSCLASRLANRSTQPRRKLGKVLSRRKETTGGTREKNGSVPYLWGRRSERDVAPFPPGELPNEGQHSRICSAVTHRWGGSVEGVPPSSCSFLPEESFPWRGVSGSFPQEDTSHMANRKTNLGENDLSSRSPFRHKGRALPTSCSIEYEVGETPCEWNGRGYLSKENPFFGLARKCLRSEGKRSFPPSQEIEPVSGQLFSLPMRHRVGPYGADRCGSHVHSDDKNAQGGAPHRVNNWLASIDEEVQNYLNGSGEEAHKGEVKETNAFQKTCFPCVEGRGDPVVEPTSQRGDPHLHRQRTHLCEETNCGLKKGRGKAKGVHAGWRNERKCEEILGKRYATLMERTHLLLRNKGNVLKILKRKIVIKKICQIGTSCRVMCGGGVRKEDAGEWLVGPHKKGGMTRHDNMGSSLMRRDTRRGKDITPFAPFDPFSPLQSRMHGELHKGSTRFYGEVVLQAKEEEPPVGFLSQKTLTLGVASELDAAAVKAQGEGYPRGDLARGGREGASPGEGGARGGGCQPDECGQPDERPGRVKLLRSFINRWAALSRGGKMCHLGSPFERGYRKSRRVASSPALLSPSGGNTFHGDGLKKEVAIRGRPYRKALITSECMKGGAEEDFTGEGVVVKKPLWEERMVHSAHVGSTPKRWYPLRCVDSFTHHTYGRCRTYDEMGSLPRKNPPVGLISKLATQKQHILRKRICKKERQGIGVVRRSSFGHLPSEEKPHKRDRIDSKESLPFGRAKVGKGSPRGGNPNKETSSPPVEKRATPLRGGRYPRKERPQGKLRICKMVAKVKNTSRDLPPVRRIPFIGRGYSPGETSRCIRGFPPSGPLHFCKRGFKSCVRSTGGGSVRKLSSEWCPPQRESKRITWVDGGGDSKVNHRVATPHAGDHNNVSERCKGEEEALEKGATDRKRATEGDTHPKKTHTGTATQTKLKRHKRRKKKEERRAKYKFNLYIRMEYCESTLENYICGRTYVNFKRNRDIIHMIILGLHYMHKNNIIHRDLKPSNIFICSNDVVKIGDFGLASYDDFGRNQRWILRAGHPKGERGRSGGNVRGLNVRGENAPAKETHVVPHTLRGECHGEEPPVRGAPYGDDHFMFTKLGEERVPPNEGGHPEGGEKDPLSKAALRNDGVGGSSPGDANQVRGSPRRSEEHCKGGKLAEGDGPHAASRANRSRGTRGGNTQDGPKLGEAAKRAQEGKTNLWCHHLVGGKEKGTNYGSHRRDRWHDKGENVTDGGVPPRKNRLPLEGKQNHQLHSPREDTLHMLSAEEKKKKKKSKHSSCSQKGEKCHAVGGTPEGSTHGSSYHTLGIGTKMYSAPEQLLGNKYNKAVDMFSLGLIIVDLFTRTETNMERTAILTNARQRILPDSLIKKHPNVAKLCKNLLSLDYESRFTSEDLYKTIVSAGNVFTFTM